MIKLCGVSHSYDGRRFILQNIDLEVGKGQIVFIMGPNGSGKTTILKIMGLLLKPTKGRILFEDRDYWSLRERERLEIRRRVIYVHEKPLFFPGTVIENMLYPLYIRGYHREEALELINKMLEENGLINIIDKRVDELSSGTLQILSILRAMLPTPDLLLLDEPLTHLDLENQLKIIKILKQYLSMGKTLIVSTHNPLFPRRMGGRIYELNNGSLREIDPNSLKTI